MSHFQGYIDPEKVGSADSAQPSTGGSGVSIPLDPSVLSHNLGVPLVVVGTKSDSMAQVEKDLGLKEEHSDFVQRQIRKFCLKYGAALVYTSSKEDRNCTLLHQYIVHRAYGGLSFKVPASVVERDAVFIPAGWDSDKKINILSEHMKTIDPDAPFDKVIQPPASANGTTEAKEITANDDQIFLQQLQVMLQRTPSKTPQTKAPPPAATSSAGHKRTNSKEGGDGKEAVLANFFNSLLAKGKTGPSKAASKDAAAAEYEKLAGKVDKKK